jgi:hypothetical protein
MSLIQIIPYNEHHPESSECSATSMMPVEVTQGTEAILLNDRVVQLQTDAAELNAIRLFYLDNTKSAIIPELYNNSEDSQIRLNVKIAVCWVMSETSPGSEQRYFLTGAVDDLLRKVSRLPQLRQDGRSVLEPLRRKLDDVALLPDFQTSESEVLYQLYSQIFIAKDEMKKQELRCLATKEEARVHLVDSYGDHYLKCLGTQVAGWLTRCLELPYDRPGVFVRKLDMRERGKRADI